MVHGRRQQNLLAATLSALYRAQNQGVFNWMVQQFSPLPWPKANVG
jgi:hypothetical protein